MQLTEKGDILKFRELANTLPTTPAVLQWISECLVSASAPRERATPSAPDTAIAPPPPAPGTAVAEPIPPAANDSLRPSSAEAAQPTPLLRRRRTTSASSSSSANAADLPGPSSTSASKRPRNSAPSRSTTAPLQYHYEEDLPRASRELLAALIKATPLGKVREALEWAATQWPEDQILAARGIPGSPSNNDGFDRRGTSTKAAARMRWTLVNAARQHEPLEERVVGEATAAQIMDSAPNADFADMCCCFERRARYLEGIRYPRSQDNLRKAIAWYIGDPADHMLSVMVDASHRLVTFHSKAVCLRSVTSVISIVLARCDDENQARANLKWKYASKWGDHIRTIMTTMSDAELTLLRRTKWIDLLLSIRQSIIAFRRREASEEQERQRQVEQQQQQWASRPPLREAHPDFRRLPSPPPTPPPTRRMWPDFEEKTMNYFATRTGGWDVAWGDR